MAKRKKNKRINNIGGLIALCVAFVMFGLAFIPVYATKIGDTVVTNPNMYDVLNNLFKNGFGESGTLIMQLGIILYFIAAIALIIVGALMVLSIVKGNTWDFLIYLLLVISAVMVLIGYLMFKDNILIGAVSTYIYFAIGVSVVVLAYKVYVILKK